MNTNGTAPAEKLEKPAPRRTPLQRLLRLCIAVAALLFCMHVLSPFLLSHIAPLGKYAQVVDETGIIPGALFYTDVEQTRDGEFNNRDSIRYFVTPDPAGKK